MLVRDRMTRRVVTIEAERPIREASRLLARHRVRQLPVRRGDSLVGIVTHRDLRNAQPPTRAVASVMTAKPYTIAPDASVDEAARLLRDYKINALPVVEGQELVGIITVSDVLDAFVLLSGVSEPTVRLVVTDRDVSNTEARAHRAVDRGRGEIKWLYRVPKSRPPVLHLRVKAPRIDEVVTALEASGFDVLGVVASTQRRSERRVRPALRA